jgi:Putative DNA-binding domain
MSADLFTDDLGALGNDELYAAIQELTNVQPNEGWRLDYTEQWDDSALKNIAGFAHSFGGLLIVGVRKTKRDVAPEMSGTESTFEYKTRIASAIAANLSPVPSYSIFECHKPGAPTKRFCVVRVRESKALHLITKKDLYPVSVYIRNEDEVRPADAVQLRMLIERERDAPSLSQNLEVRANHLQVSKSIRCGYKDTDSDAWHMSPYQDSPTHLKLEMIPAESIQLELERSHEVSMVRLVSELYPRVHNTVLEGAASRAEVRAASSYEYLWYHKKLDQERRWRIMSTGEIGHATQVKYQAAGATQWWSLVDVAVYLILFVRLSKKWWESIGYLGGGYLYAQFNVPGLTLLRHSDGYFTGTFDVSNRPGHAVYRPSIRKDAILASPSPGTGADAVATVNYFTVEEKLPRLVTSVLNQLLRPLGFAVVWDLLQEGVGSMTHHI